MTKRRSGLAASARNAPLPPGVGPIPRVGDVRVNRFASECKGTGPRARVCCASPGIGQPKNAGGAVDWSHAWGRKTMERVRIDEIELECEVRGSGEPVVLIHAGVCAEWFKPLMAEAALTGSLPACQIPSRRLSKQQPLGGFDQRRSTGRTLPLTHARARN